MKRKLFRFLISRRVPNGAPGRRTETLASQRKLPSCMLPSQMPSQTTSVCSARAYSTASALERMSGSVTISSSGVPARLRSMPDQSPWKSSGAPARLAADAVQRLAGVLFEMGAGQLDAVRDLADEELDRAALDDRRLVLADLVALRQVGVEVVLAREDRDRRDRRADRQAEADRPLDRAAVGDRQGAGQGEVDRRRLRVRRGAERGRRAAEDLRAGRQLGVGLDADHDLEAAHQRAGRRFAAHRRGSASGGTACASRSRCWKACAACSSVPSAK